MKSMIKKRFLLSSLLFWVVMASVALLTERVYLFSETFDLGNGMIPMMPNKVFAAFFVLTFLCYLIYIYFEAHVGKTKENFFLAGILILLFVSGVMAIWINSTAPFVIDGIEYTVLMRMTIKLTYTIILGVMLLTVYSFLAIFPKNKVDSKTLHWFYYAVVLVGLVSIVVSLIVEFPMYVGIFSGNIEMSNITIRSFYNNENTYGTILLFSFIGLGLINYRKPSWVRYVFMFIFAIAMIFSTSFLCIVITAAFAIAYLILIVIRLFKEKKKVQAIVHIVVIPLFVGVLIAALCVLNYLEVTPIVNFFTFINKLILEKDFLSFSHRIPNWQNAIAVLSSPLEWVFGRGYGSFNDVIALYSEARYVDSGFITILGSFGIVGLVAYACFIAYVIYMFVVTCKRGKFNRVILPFIAFILILVHGAFENTVFLFTDTKGLVITAMLILPIAIEYNAVKQPDLVNEYLDDVNIMHEPKGRCFDNVANLLAAILIAGVISVLCASLLFVETLPNRQTLFTIMISVGIGLLGLFFSYPFLIKLWGRKLKKAHFVLSLIGNLIITFGLSSALAYAFGALANDILVGVIFFITGMVIVSLLQILIYALIFNQMKEYATYLGELISSTILNTILTTMVFVFVAYATSFYIDISILLFLVYVVSFFIIYLTSLVALPNNTLKSNKWIELGSYYNDVYLKNVRKNLLKEQTPVELLVEKESDSVEIDQI